MSKNVNIIILIVGIIGMTSFFSYNYVMHGGHRNLTTEKRFSQELRHPLLQNLSQTSKSK